MVQTYDIDVSKINIKPGDCIHFVGIGGSSMSGLAEITVSRGFTVSGSDRSKSEITERLESLGVKCFEGHSAENVPVNCSLLVYTLAVSDDNPEVMYALTHGIPIIERGSFLGALSKQYENCIAVSGTHGKTTTTSMLAQTMICSDKNPTVHIGGIVRLFKSNVRIGKGEHFITEACEYHANFLNLSPSICIILNVEAEHLDFYQDMDGVRNAFRELIAKIPANGTAVLCSDDDETADLARFADCDIVTFGLKESKNLTNKNGKRQLAHFSAANLMQPENIGGLSFGGYSYRILKNGALFTKVTLGVPGLHNVINSLACAACADVCGCPAEAIAEGLRSFNGTGRRFDMVGTVNGAPIIDDYAHHPTEIKATIAAARTVSSGTVWCVFQPHTYSRVRMFKEKFCEVLKAGDKVIVTDVYAAREPLDEAATSDLLSQYFNEKGLPSMYIREFESISDYLRKNVTAKDIVLLLGAGTVNKIADILKD